MLTILNFKFSNYTMRENVMEEISKSYHIMNLSHLEMNTGEILFALSHILNTPSITSVIWFKNTLFQDLEGLLFILILNFTNVDTFDISNTGLSHQGKLNIIYNEIIKRKKIGRAHV